MLALDKKNSKKGGRENLQELKALFESTRSQTLSLCRALEPDDYLLQTTSDVSPVKWHLAHTSWFFDRFIIRHFYSEESFLPEIDYLFNSYYMKVGEHLPKEKRGFIARPTLKKILEYREWTEEKIIKCITEKDWSAEMLERLQIGIHHEQQHQELILMDLKRNFFSQRQVPIYSNEATQQIQQTEILFRDLSWSDFSEGFYSVGFSQSPSPKIQNELQPFAYDNEQPQHQVHLREFSIQNSFVTNGDFLEFIESGAYEKPDVWLSDAWSLIKKENFQHPLYWQKADDRWFEFSLGGWIPLRSDLPVCHLSFYEAEAYARWKKARLPTEFEWEIAASISQKSEGQKSKGFLESESLHPLSHEWSGELWTWTSSSYTAYPGYRCIDEDLQEYNSKFMCNQFVLKGGCRLTPLVHYRTTYRNFYYPHQNWMMSGLRLAK